MIGALAWTLILSLASGVTVRTDLGIVPEEDCWQIGHDIADKFEAERAGRKIVVECVRTVTSNAN